MSTINQTELAELLSPGDVEGASNADKGRSLESALRYAFECIPGVDCLMQNQKNSFETEEVDLIFSNVAHEDGLLRFETEFLVEAKNWSNKVGAIEINWFSTKMRRRNRKTGVLVAASGITGHTERMTAARQELVSSLQEGQEVIVLTREELEGVSSGKRLAELLLQKRDHLVSRTELYVADPADLKSRRGFITFGSDAFVQIMRSERLAKLEEAKKVESALPPGTSERVEALRQGLNEVKALNERSRSDSSFDPLGQELRVSLLNVLGILAAWLADLGVDDPSTILTHQNLSGLEKLDPVVGSKLWTLLADYYVDELPKDKEPDVFEMKNLFSLSTLVVEGIVRIDDYVPDDWEAE
ncbi:MAG: restriction endonuclease [Solirubrobacterales bacterium]|nr:restriction endonuclease [Solirubrobacterales bacterium]